MIQLRSDCLVFEVSGGDKIPCSVEKLTIEVLAESLEDLDPEVIREAAAAVLHYFRDDLGRETVTLVEFTEALEHVLSGLGYQIADGTITPVVDADMAPDSVGKGGDQGTADPCMVECDLGTIAESLGEDLEMRFFQHLRTELRSLLAAQPEVIRFNGLRRCAIRLARARRWCPRSLQVSDEIVGFLRDCWGAEMPKRRCSMFVDGSES
ncbi:MAG: hypothetical protein AB7O66_12930 [Limisphaerales bacterium]